MTSAQVAKFRTPLKRTFMARFQRYEPEILDHSAIIQAKTCKRKYFYRIVLGFVPRETAPYFIFGSCYHKFREELEKAWKNASATDQKNPESQLAMCQLAIAEALKLWKDRKARDPEPGSKFDFLTQARLLSSCLHSFKHWQNEKVQGRIIVLATEQNFVVPLPDGSYTGGKADQIILWNNKVWGRDFKTSSKTQDHFYTRTLDPNDQFSRYTYGEAKLAGQPVEGILVEVMFNAKGTKTEPQKGPKIFQHLATRAHDQMQQWIKEQVFYNKILDLMREDDIWPMEEHHCPYCDFHSVCTKPSEASQMAKLQAEFSVSPWDFQNRDVD